MYLEQRRQAMLQLHLSDTYFVLLSSSNRKYELLPIVLGLGHETMVCAVCLSIFLLPTKVPLILDIWRYVLSLQVLKRG